MHLPRERHAECKRKRDSISEFVDLPHVVVFAFKWMTDDRLLVGVPGRKIDDGHLFLGRVSARSDAYGGPFLIENIVPVFLNKETYSRRVKGKRKYRSAREESPSQIRRLKAMSLTDMAPNAATSAALPPSLDS